MKALLSEAGRRSGGGEGYSSLRGTGFEESRSGGKRCWVGGPSLNWGPEKLGLLLINLFKVQRVTFFPTFLLISGKDIFSLKTSLRL